MIFNFNNMFSKAKDAGDSDYTNDELLGAYKDLSYEECRAIYRFWPLGRRVINALPNFAMSPGRSFKVNHMLPEAIEALQKAELDLNIERVAFETIAYSRIYGLSFVYVATELEPNQAVTYDYIQSNKAFKFNILDPLAKGGGIVMDTNPLSPTFNRPVSLNIRGYDIHTQRLYTCYNDIPLYYKFNPSSFSFSGPSVFQNMTLLIRSWNRAIISLQRMATKASAMILQSKDNIINTGINIKQLEKTLEFLRSIENDGIANIKVGEDIKFFNLTGVSEIDTILNKIQSSILIALSDTPSNILLDKELSSGLNDGDNDMKSIIIAVDNFRKNTLAPLYKFLDKFLCYKAFSIELLFDIKEKYPQFYSDYTIIEIFNDLLNSYSYEFNELYPKTDNEKADLEGRKLDNLLKIRDLGSEISGLEEALNSLNIFDNIDFTLNENNLNNDLYFDNDLSIKETPPSIDKRDIKL